MRAMSGGSVVRWLIVTALTGCSASAGPLDRSMGGSSSAGKPNTGGNEPGSGGAGASSAGGTPSGGTSSGGSNTGGNPSGGTSTGGTNTGGANTGGTNTGGTNTGGASTGGTNTGGTNTGGTNTGGNPTGGTGGAATGGTSGTGGTATGGTGGTTGTWHGAIASSVTQSKLDSEYANWKSKFTQACSDGSSVVLKDAGNVVSEGIGYGMLISASMNDQTLFDRLWKHYRDHLDPNGLMNWSWPVCAAAGNNNANAATDGDLDAAMALVQASVRWPSGGYLSQAETLAGKILQYETETCTGHATVRPGDKWGGCSDNGQVNPSYYAPGYFRTFAAHFPAQSTKWTALVDGSYYLYPILQARMSGLVPDWSKYDGSDWYGSQYGYDACRAPWRVATEYAWSGDSRARTFLVNITTWVDGHGGLPSAAQQQNSAFIGSFALSGIYDQNKLNTYVTAWMGAQMDDTPYYQGTLRVLYLLLAAGKFPSGM